MLKSFMRYLAALLLIVFFISACSNSPYDNSELSGKTYFSSYVSHLKYLDPVVSYYEHERVVIDQAYECLLQYHYLKRPYQLEPCLADAMPVISKKKIINGGKSIEVTSWKFKIKTNIYFAENPCFDFNPAKKKHTRLLTSRDFVYSFKRMADPKLNCPIFPVLAPRILGMTEFFRRNETNQTTDYKLPIAGILAEDDFTFEILLTSPYPQLKYWLAMHFTSPVPEEAVDYYRNLSIEENGGKLPEGPQYLPTLIGTGAFKLGEYIDRRRIVLEKNELFRDDFYPSSGEASDRENGLLEDAGKKLPLLDRIVITYEGESIPRWNKFLQGYYDASGVPKEHFDRVISGGNLGKDLLSKSIRLEKALASDIYYLGFNMLDPVLGGMGERSKLLRQALSLSFDREKYLRIFANGRGEVPHGPIAPGITGWRKSGNKYSKYDLTEAKRLLALAGYPGGVDAKTGKQLVINYDNASTSSSARPSLKYIQEQFESLGIKVNLLSVDLNTFRKKIQEGNYQIFDMGWILDYPDPENFLFLLYSSNSTVKYQANNEANWADDAFDKNFRKMETMEDSPQRLAYINQMVDRVNEEAPWLYLYHSMDFILIHDWTRNIKLTDLVGNRSKYYRVDEVKRSAYVKAQNQPQYFWPVLIALLFLGLLTPAAVKLYKRMSQ